MEEEALAARRAPRPSKQRVFGSTVANDVSARDVQFADGQWLRAKTAPWIG